MALEIFYAVAAFNAALLVVNIVFYCCTLKKKREAEELDREAERAGEIFKKGSIAVQAEKKECDALCKEFKRRIELCKKEKSIAEAIGGLSDSLNSKSKEAADRDINNNSRQLYV